VDSQGVLTTGGQTGVGNASNGQLQLSRGTTANTNIIGNFTQLAYNSAGSATINIGAPAALFAYDLPNTVGAQIYAVQAKYTSGAGVLTYGGTTQMSAKEIFI